MSEKREWDESWDLKSIPDDVWKSEVSRRTRLLAHGKSGRPRTCGHPTRDINGDFFFANDCPVCKRARYNFDSKTKALGEISTEQ